MLTTALALAMLSGIALFLMTSEERARLRQIVLAAARRALEEARRPSPGGPFDDFLRSRTGRPLVTPALGALCALVFLLMVFAPGAVDDLDTLVSWGGNIAPRTTGGEWWRLVTAMFIHAGPLHLLATVAGLVPLGLILERAVGRTTFAAMYLASGILASVVSLWTTPPTSVTVGASGAIAGIYGLLLASLVWGLVSRPLLPVPMTTVKQLGAAAAVFLLYNLQTDWLGRASELAGLATGLVGGLVVARGVTREKPAVRRAMAMAAATIAIAVVSAVPLRGIVDARVDIARVAAVEDKTAGTYDEAVARFRRHRIDAEDLAQLIDGTIIPELQAARAQLELLRGVPSEQAPLVAAAKEYLELREESWRRRAEGLLASSTSMLRRAEETERVALDALQRAQPR